MATLLVGVNASETLWQISAPIAQDTIYLKVGTEIVSVLSDFTGGTLLPTGAVVPSKVRVKRPVGGTTAASHLQGATLTEYADASVFAGASEGGGGIGFYAQDTDPGAVGAGSVWKDTSTDVWHVRDAGDAAWENLIGIVIDDGALAVGQLNVGPAFLGLQATAGSGAIPPEASLEAVSTDSVATASIGASRSGVQAKLFFMVDNAGVRHFITLGLPTSNPGAAGELWNDGGTMKVSAG